MFITFLADYLSSSSKQVVLVVQQLYVASFAHATNVITHDTCQE